MEHNATPQRACKQYHYASEHGTTVVKVLELLDANFGLYVWPSSLVLAEYIFQRLDMFTGTKDNPKVILELGSGTALPSLLLAKAPSHDSRFLITTDRSDVPEILHNVREAFKENGMSSLYPDDAESRIMVRGLNWGDFTLSNAQNLDGGLLQLISDITQIRPHKNSKIDIILGSDTFYNPPGTDEWIFARLDFEPLLATVSYIINRHNQDCVFLSTYQNRSSKRNIDHLLQKWDLEGRLIDWEDFGFDMSKFVVGGHDDDDDDDTSEYSLDIESEGADSFHQDDDEQWLRLAKQEVARDMEESLGLPSGGPKVSLVDYSSGSESDDGAATAREQRDMSDARVLDDQMNTSKDGSSHRMGSGGALSSVHLLWICKRGRGDGVVAWRSPAAGA
ncbi:Methyltransferase-like protein 23 [Mortierella sp. GBA30]|nr:Methyltransferase-like protein 23 [Mortierella sp. GBA30]